MEITRRDHGKIAVLDVAGRLAGSISGGSRLSESVLDSVGGDDSPGASPRLEVLLDLAACTGTDSLGIGELISLHVTSACRIAAVR